MGKGTFNCVKWMLTIFNFLFIVCGLGICAFGVWILVSPSTINNLIGENLAPILSYILLGIGGLIVLISFCGCAGAGLENRCLLCLFFTVLCGIFVACLVGAILISIFRKDLEWISKQKLRKIVKDNYGKSLAWTDFWDNIQKNFACCGIRNSVSAAITIYQKTPWYKSASPKKVPLSCCKRDPSFRPNSKDGRFVPNSAYINQEQCQNGVQDSMNDKGCAVAVMGLVYRRAILFLCVLVAMAVMLIIGMVLALVHLRNIINRRYYDYSHPI